MYVIIVLILLSKNVIQGQIQNFEKGVRIYYYKNYAY